MGKIELLLVEDEPILAAILQESLEKRRFPCIYCRKWRERMDYVP